MSAVFSIDKNKVRQSFASAAETYDGLAALQRKVGLDLLADLTGICADQCIVDIGCGTGFLTRELLTNLSARKIIAVDIALSMMQITKNKLAQYEKIQYICADAEFLPLQSNSVEKIVSNLALQWCHNLTDVFDGFNQVLSQKGQLCFSTFGPTTLQELKQAWSDVDSYTHVNHFYSTEQLLFFLKKAGFEDIHIQTKQYQSYYQTVMELMRELKGIGAHNVLAGRNRKTTRKSDMDKMISGYKKMTINGLIPATYEVIFVTARAG
jgi:malonyl-CoA O-methyltransferase